MRMVTGSITDSLAVRRPRLAVEVENASETIKNIDIIANKVST